MRLRQLAGALAGLLAVAISGSAAAQEQTWLRDPKVGEGVGYRVGSLELHPGFAGEFGYDSNMFLRNSDENVVDVWRIRITPSLSLSTLKGERNEDNGLRKIEFSAGLAATYNEYIANGNDDSGGVDKVSDFRNIGANANINLVINPNGPFGGRLHGSVIRTVQPSNLSDTSAAYNRINAIGGAELMWIPGGGLFDWRVGYQYSTTIFEESMFEDLNNGTHQLATRGRWRFLPRTALLFDASTSFVRFFDIGDTGYLLDSNPIRARIGLNGLMTNNFALLAMVGWGVSFTKDGTAPGENFDSPIAQVELTYYPTPAPGLTDSAREASLTLSRISLGYTRDFYNSYYGSYFSRDRGYLFGSYFFAQRVLFSAEAGIANVHFPDLYFSNGTFRQSSFNDKRYDATLFAEYRLLETVGLNASFNYVKNDSISLPIGAGAEEDLSYDRFQIFAGARWFM